MKKVKIALLLLVTMIIITISCNTPSVVSTPSASVKSYAISVIGSTDTVFTAPQTTVYSALSNYIQTGNVLYTSSDLTSVVKFAYVKSNGVVYYSPKKDGQFFPYTGNK